MEDRGQKPGVDQLIRELIYTGRTATADEVAQIIGRMATAPFNTDTIRVPAKHRGASYEGHTLTAREPSLVYHLVKRVVIESQWAIGTTEAEYLSDLQEAVRAPSARLTVYQRRGDHVAATVTRTDQVIPSAGLGADPRDHILVVYSADSGMIVTGYQFSTIHQTGIPGEARWLK